MKRTLALKVLKEVNGLPSLPPRHPVHSCRVCWRLRMTPPPLVVTWKTGGGGGGGGGNAGSESGHTTGRSHVINVEVESSWAIC